MSERMPISDEVLDAQLANYRTHKWKTHRSSVPGEPGEVNIVCEDCGCENFGDPVEMASIGGVDYPACEDTP